MGTARLYPDSVGTTTGSPTASPSGTLVSVVGDPGGTDSNFVYQGGTPLAWSVVYGMATVSMPAGSLVKSLTSWMEVHSGYTSSLLNFSLDSSAGNIGSFSRHPNSNSDTPTYSDYSDTFAVALTQAQLDSLTATVAQPTVDYIYFYQLYVDVVYALPPTASAVTPSGAITTTRQPTIGWTFTQGTDGSGGQTYFRVKVFSAAQYGIGGFDPASSPNSYDSGTINSASTSHTLSAPLANGVTYKAYVLVYQTTSGAAQPSTSYAASSAFNIAIIVPTPTAVTPAAATTVTTSRPALGASVAAMTGGSTMRREWQLASDAGFTANLLAVIEPVGNLTATPSAPFAFPALPTRRYQGVWYIKARALDQDGIYGSYSAGQSFTISHPGNTASRAPSGGSTIQYSTTPTVTWAFSDIDTDDFQTKYQVQLWKTSAPGTILDSGVVTSGALLYQFVSGIDATWKNTELRWKVQVWDQDNVSGGYSVENIFYLRDLPVVTVVPAAGAVITNAAPLVTWTNVFSGGAIEAQWKVDIIRASVVQATSGWVVGSALSWQCPSPVVTVGPTHQVTVSVIDSNGLQGSTTNNFTATYAATTIPVFTVDGSQYSASGLNIIDWSGATADSNFYSWKVLRRNVGATTWTNLFETQTVGTRSYRDFLAPSQQAVQYVVVQTDISIGVYVESTYVPLTTTGTSARYMLVCPSLESLNMTLYKVKSDSFSSELESATINLIGRGRRVEYGSRYGQTGSLSAQLRDIVGGPTARQQRLAVEALRDSQRVVYFRNPFGDVFQCSMPSAKFDRTAGVGLLEYVDLSLDYVEVTA